MEDLTGITGNSYVVVDLQKIKRNVEKIRAHIGENVKFLPVLKGATCGHGLEEIAEFLVSECQFDMLCVGHTIEAERIRNFGVNCDILVLGGTPFNNIPYVVENKITTTLSNADYCYGWKHRSKCNSSGQYNYVDNLAHQWLYECSRHWILCAGSTFHRRGKL